MKNKLSILALAIGLTAQANAQQVVYCNCDPNSQSCPVYTVSSGWWSEWGPLILSAGLTALAYLANFVEVAP